jgi:hypothetical protein
MTFAADSPFCQLQVRSRIGLALTTVLGAAMPLGAVTLGGLPLGALPLGSQFLGALPLGPRVEGVGAIVQAMCLTAFESEMSRAGKAAPEGMAGFACRCVTDRIMQGRGVEEARKECRQATIQRFPI